MKDLRTGVSLLQGPTKSGIYEWYPPPPAIHTATSSLSTNNWHHRLGHPSYSILQLISSNFNLSIPKCNAFHCNSCDCNKSQKMSFYQNFISSSGPLDVIYTDVWSSPTLSYDGYKYYILFVNHFTKYMWYYPLKKKSDSKDVFIQFKLKVEKYFQRSIVTIFSDNGVNIRDLIHFLLLMGLLILLFLHTHPSTMVILKDAIVILWRQDSHF